MQKIIESPKRMFIIILLSGILGIIAGECYGQTPNYVKLKSIEPAPGSGYAIGTGTNGSPVYTQSLSVTTLSATNGYFLGSINTQTNNASYTSASSGMIGSLNSGTITSGSFIRSGGTGLQFLKADGTVDNNTYLTTTSAVSTYVPLTRQITVNGQTFDLSANRTYTTGDALVANTLGQFASTPSSTLAGVISDETGTGPLVFATNPQFTSNIGVGVASPTTGLANVHFMKGTGSTKIGEYTSGRGAIWFNQTTPSSTNWSMSADLSNNTFVNGQSQVFIAINGSILSRFTSSSFILTGQDLQLATAGKGITMKTGTAQAIGTATFSAGSAVITNSNVAASNCVITPVLTASTSISQMGVMYGAGSFTITSSNVTDSREVRYTIFYFN